jgi:iron complex transport system ATP-binding protein
MSLAAQGLVLALGGTRALDGVSAAFARGRVTTILGPNGAGKSSFLTCLAGLRGPDAGDVMLDGRGLGDFGARVRAQKIGFLPQTADVHWDIDVATLVGLGRYPWRGRFGGGLDDAAAIAEALAQTDLTAMAGRVVNTLSGGERSRALLARVLAGRPEWLLADEPLASLDPAHQSDVLDVLREIAATGAGVVVVLHDLNQAARVADDVLLMRGGRVVAQGPPEAVLTPALIGETYGVSAQIGHLPDGQRFIVTGGRG